MHERLAEALAVATVFGMVKATEDIRDRHGNMLAAAGDPWTAQCVKTLAEQGYRPRLPLLICNEEGEGWEVVLEGWP